jgi:hypothetical protein
VLRPPPVVRSLDDGLLSPDGGWVLYDSCLAGKRACESEPAPYAVFLIPSSGGKDRLLVHTIAYVVWSPRSDRTVAVKDEHTLVSLDLAGRLTVLDRDGIARELLA